jgi:hypothetical protein
MGVAACSVSRNASWKEIVAVIGRMRARVNSQFPTSNAQSEMFDR